MRWIALALLVTLAGCADGTILGADRSNMPGASYISVSLSDEESVFLKPLNASGRDEVRLRNPGLWISQGWFKVNYFCDSPQDGPPHIIIDENGEDDSIHVIAGHLYKLSCDDNKPFVLHIVDQGTVDDQR